MAIREYIGARYVPKFSEVNGGVWANTYSYEALEIVKNGNDYYTSKKPVPVGVAITNTDYWTLTGQYNSAIIGINDRIDDIEEEKVTQLKDRCYLFFADSFDSDRSISDDGWIDPLCSYVGITDYIKCSKGSYGFLGYISGYTWLSLAVNNLTEAQKSRITDVFIGGDAADYDNAPADVTAAMGTLDTWLRSELPNLKSITFAFLSYLYSPTGSRITGQWSMYHQVRAKAQSLGWNWIEGSNFIIADPRTRENANDTMHPDSNGVASIARYLTEAIQGRNVEVESAYGDSATIQSAFTGSGAVDVTCRILDGQFAYTLQANRYLAITENLNSSNWFPLYKLGKKVPVFGEPTYIPVVSVSSGNVYTTGIAAITIATDRQTIMIKFIGFKNGVLTTDDHLIIPPFGQVIPLNTVGIEVSAT